MQGFELPQDPAQLLNLPIINSIAFHPRACEKNTSRFPSAIDGHFTISPTIQLGYRYFVNPSNRDAPTMIAFHGNAEVCADYDFVVENQFWVLGVHLLLIDYRGFGWSTGSPTLTTLVPDVERLWDDIPSVLSDAGVGSGDVFLFGRSIGSVCAVHLSSLPPPSTTTTTNDDNDQIIEVRVRGLVIENGICVLTELPMVSSMAMMIPG